MKRSISTQKLGRVHSIIVKLSDKLFPDSTDESKRKSLLEFYRRRGYLSKAQQGLALGLLRENQKTRVAEVERVTKMYLYAISSGTSIKLGMSSDIARRLKSLQTSSPTPLKVLWRFFIGYDRGFAVKQEKKLHRFCKDYRQCGEWFGVECLEKVKEFHIYQTVKRMEEPMELPAALIDNIAQY